MKMNIQISGFLMPHRLTSPNRTPYYSADQRILFFPIAAQNSPRPVLCCHSSVTWHTSQTVLPPERLYHRRAYELDIPALCRLGFETGSPPVLPHGAGMDLDLLFRITIHSQGGRGDEKVFRRELQGEQSNAFH